MPVVEDGFISNENIRELQAAVNALQEGGGTDSGLRLAQFLQALTRQPSGFIARHYTGAAINIEDQAGDLFIVTAEQVFVYKRTDPSPTEFDTAYLNYDSDPTLSWEPIPLPPADDTEVTYHRLVYDFATDETSFIEGTPGAGEPAVPETAVILGTVQVPPNATELDEMRVESEGQVPRVEFPGTGTASLAQGNGTVVLNKHDVELLPHQTDLYESWESPLSGNAGPQNAAAAVRMQGMRLTCLATTAGQAAEDIVIVGLDNGAWFGSAAVDGDPEVPVYAMGDDGVVRTLDGTSLGASKTLTEGDRIELSKTNWISD